MRVRVLKPVSIVAQPGSVVEVTAGQAAVLMQAGMAEAAAPEAETAKADPTERPAAKKTVRKAK